MSVVLCLTVSGIQFILLCGVMLYFLVKKSGKNVLAETFQFSGITHSSGSKSSHWS